MQAAADCHTGLGEWRQAEMLMLGIAERYDAAMSYYFWCRANGHGNLDKARQMARTGLRVADPYEVGMFQIAEGNAVEALATLRRDYANRKNLFSGLYAAVILDQQGKAAERDELLQALAQARPDAGPNSLGGEERAVALARRMRDLLRSGIDATTERAVAEGVMPASLRDNAGSARYVAAKFLSLHGQASLAKDFYLHCFKGPDQGIHSRALAAVELEKLGVAIPTSAAAAQPAGEK